MNKTGGAKMKKIICVLFVTVITGIACSTNTKAVAQEQQNNSKQQVTITGVQGNLTELAGVLGKAKANVVNLEKNGKNTLMLQTTIREATESIQQAKDLLRQYDYPNKSQIQQEVNDLEQRLFAVVMSL